MWDHLLLVFGFIVCGFQFSVVIPVCDCTLLWVGVFLVIAEAAWVVNPEVDNNRYIACFGCSNLHVTHKVWMQIVHISGLLSFSLVWWIQNSVG